MDASKETPIAIDESNKRKRSVTSTSEADTSMNVDHEANKNMGDEQSNKAEKRKQHPLKRSPRKQKKRTAQTMNG